MVLTHIDLSPELCEGRQGESWELHFLAWRSGMGISISQSC